MAGCSRYLLTLPYPLWFTLGEAAVVPYRWWSSYCLWRSKGGSSGQQAACASVPHAANVRCSKHVTTCRKTSFSFFSSFSHLQYGSKRGVDVSFFFLNTVTCFAFFWKVNGSCLQFSVELCRKKILYDGSDVDGVWVEAAAKLFPWSPHIDCSVFFLLLLFHRQRQ